MATNKNVAKYGVVEASLGEGHNEQNNQISGTFGWGKSLNLFTTKVRDQAYNLYYLKPVALVGMQLFLIIMGFRVHLIICGFISCNFINATNKNICKFFHVSLQLSQNMKVKLRTCYFIKKTHLWIKRWSFFFWLCHESL